MSRTHGPSPTRTRPPRCGSAVLARRSFCCRTPHAFEATLTLPPHEGGTVCELRVFGSCPYRTVEIHELPDNPGAPASTRLDAIAAWVHDAMLLCRHEPTWLEYWPARALLGLVRSDAGRARHRLWRVQDSWLRVPFSRAEYRELVRRGRVRLPMPHDYGGGSHPW
jgi:hypothetical protein